MRIACRTSIYLHWNFTNYTILSWSHTCNKSSIRQTIESILPRKPPFGYLLLWFVESSSVFCSLFTIVPPICMLIGASMLMMSFVKDISVDLSNLSERKTLTTLASTSTTTTSHGTHRNDRELISHFHLIMLDYFEFEAFELIFSFLYLFIWSRFLNAFNSIITVASSLLVFLAELVEYFNCNQRNSFKNYWFKFLFFPAPLFYWSRNQWTMQIQWS